MRHESCHMIPILSAIGRGPELATVLMFMNMAALLLTLNGHLPARALKCLRVLQLALLTCWPQSCIHSTCGSAAATREPDTGATAGRIAQRAGSNWQSMRCASWTATMWLAFWSKPRRQWTSSVTLIPWPGASSMPRSCSAGPWRLQTQVRAHRSQAHACPPSSMVCKLSQFLVLVCGGGALKGTAARVMYLQRGCS